LLRAEQAVHAPDRCCAQHGPNSGENPSEFVTAMEYEGREMRNQVGPAGWLTAS
jgi:hypothetical protein